jgi:hypothetical protein
VYRPDIEVIEGDRPIIFDCMRAGVAIESTEGGGGFRDDWNEDDESVAHSTTITTSTTTKARLVLAVVTPWLGKIYAYS